MSSVATAPTRPLESESVDVQRIAWPDVAKALAILLVVLIHSQTELRFVGVRSRAVDEFFHAGSTMFMPLFFFVSGLFALRATAAPWRDLWNRRLLPLAWLFLVWQPLVFAYKSLETLGLPNQPEKDELGQVLRFVVSPVRPNGELWFLWLLIAYYVAFKLARRLPLTMHLGIAAVASFAWLSFAADVFSPEQLRALGNGWRGVPVYYLFFAAGALFGARILDALRAPPRAALVGIVGVWLGAFLAFRLTDTLGAVGVPLILRVLGVAAGAAVARALASSRPLLWIGQRTLPIYVAHITVVVLATFVVYTAGAVPSREATSLLLIVGVALIALVAALGLYFALSRGRGAFMYEPPPTVVRRLSLRS